MRRSFLFAATLAFGLAGCDSAAPSTAASADGSPPLTCTAPVLHNITPGGSNWVNISFTPSSTNGRLGSVGYVEVREVGTSTWLEAEASNTASNIKAYQLHEPATGGTAYQVRARQSCNRGVIDQDFEHTVSPYSNTLTDDLIYYPVGQNPGGGA